MVFIAGQKQKVLFGAFDLTQFFNTASMSQDQNVIETSVFGSDDAQYLAGIQTATVGLGGFYDGASDGVDEEFSNVFNGSETPLTVFNGGDTAGNRAFLLNSQIQNYTIDSAVADAVQINSSFTGSNFGNGKSLYALTNTSATVTTTSVDMGASSSIGGQAHIHVTAHGSSNIAVKIQSSADNGSFADVTGLGFTAITGTGSERKATASTTTVNRYVRLVITRTSGSATFSVAYAHNVR